MALRSDGIRTRDRILATCARLFLYQGYRETTIRQILEEAQVSSSSFQHFFGSKDGVLDVLVSFMFDAQFDAGSLVASAAMPPVATYAAGAAVQLSIAEANENLREIYVEAYTHESTLDFVQHATAKRLHQILAPERPDLTEDELLELSYGTTGMMRGYMARPCDEGFSLERKVRTYVASELRVYRLPEGEIQEVLALVAALDLRGIAWGVVEKAMADLARLDENAPADGDQA